MQRRLFFLLLLVIGGLALGVLFFPPLTSAAPPTEPGIPDQTILTLPGPEASEGDASLLATDSGYRSPTIAAESQFTHLLLRWEASTPPGADVRLEVRTSTDGQAWKPWDRVPESTDLWLPEDGDEVFWSSILYAGEGMRFWQVRAVAEAAPDGQRPQVRRIEVNTVDARFGQRDPRSSAEGFTLASLDKPPVVSRTAWGCPDGQGSRVSPAYRFVTHLIIHHTAGSNTLYSSEETWADRVRSIWSFHTYTRGWGDIGYNYIVAPDGTIYEGRAGGDNAVGFHDTANYGSMGVSLIGTYETVDPPPAMQDKLVELLAWKANQNDIAPLGSSYYHGCQISPYCLPYAPGAVIMNIAGHRQVTPGRTSCPGERVVNLMATIRERVRAYIDEGGGDPTRPDNGDLVIEELESSFAPSQANWYRAPCGDNGHTYYTYATDTSAESTNWASWTPNIPERGTYRVYVAIPQGCGLGHPPYASTGATYRIHTAGGTVERTVDHNTAEPWVDLGSYTFEAGTNGFVELDDLTNEPYSLRRVIFFDSIKWVPEEEVVPQDNIELLDVSYGQTTIPAGGLLKIRFTVRNGSDETIQGQAPQAGILPAGGFDPADGYVYDEGECFLGNEEQSYPDYPKEHNRFRVMLGPQGREVPCIGNVGGYPWRWGINGSLAPGATSQITGYVRFRQPGVVTLHAGLIQEYVKYHAEMTATTTVTITEEQQPPVLASYDTLLRPLAHVYRLGDVPDNFLSRTTNPLSVGRGPYVGSFVWDGSTLSWREGDTGNATSGPLGVADHFLIEQTLPFLAPASGAYTFRTTSYGSSWLWIDGQAVLVNEGMTTPADMFNEISGTIQLEAGMHVLAFKYYELTNRGMAGYAVKPPGAEMFAPPTGGPGGGAERTGATFTTTPTLTLAADDMGGSGVTTLRYSWDGQSWHERVVLAGAAHLGPLNEGAYHLRYQAIDAVGNRSPIEELVFTVDLPNEQHWRIFLPLVLRGEASYPIFQKRDMERP
jgi:hypothetical protein